MRVWYGKVIIMDIMRYINVGAYRYIERPLLCEINVYNKYTGNIEDYVMEFKVNS